jgi:mono/diheme cytochrome c family protein
VAAVRCIGYVPGVAGEDVSERARERRSMAVALGALVAVVALSVAFAIYLGLHDARDVQARGPGGVKLTAAEVQGRALFADTCATCHTLAAVNAVGRVGPNLDVLRPPVSLVLYAIHNGFALGYGQMPAGLYSGQDARDIAEFVGAVAGR